MNTVADCTVPEKILVVADQLEKEGQSPFSAEALIVAAWQKFPKTFGLKGYTDQYPDSNKVLSSIMGAKGLTNRGWLLKMGQKLYSLSREGRQAVPFRERGHDLGGEGERLGREDLAADVGVQPDELDRPRRTCGSPAHPSPCRRCTA